MGELYETVFNCDLDVIIFTETWLYAQVQDGFISHPDYNLIRLYRAHTMPNGLIKKGGGICIFVRKGITIDRENCCSISNADIELLGINIKKGYGCRLNVFGLYRPPRGNWNDALSTLDDSIKNTKRLCKGELAILGDFNIDLLSEDRPACELLKLCSASGLKQLIQDPTRMTRKSSTCLDLIITNMEWVSEATVVESNISDHFPIFLSRKKDRLDNKLTSISCRSFKDFDLNAFREDLSVFDFDSLLGLEANVAWESMWKYIVEICDKHCPTRTFTAKRKPPFIDDVLLKRMKERDLVFCRARRSGDNVEMI